MSIAKHIDISGITRVACKEEDGKSIYTLKVNKNMDSQNREWINVFTCDDPRELSKVLEALAIALIHEVKFIEGHIGWLEGWDDAYDNRRMSEGYLWMDDMRDMEEESNA